MKTKNNINYIPNKTSFTNKAIECLMRITVTIKKM